jgi:nitrate/TMAO reductase-like tetraheme cytochrome c subunit
MSIFKKVKTRKTYTCQSCHKTIPKGEQAYVASWTSQRLFQPYVNHREYYCVNCHEIKP